MRKDSLVKGTIILMIAAFTARFLGAVQRIPLVNLLGKDGMATYGIAYNIYFMLLIIATAGFPSALSKLISERTALEQYEEANKIFKAAVYFSLVMGVISTVLIYILAPYYAVHISLDADATLSIRSLSPALLLFPLIAMLRGYFQGRQMMMGNGLSQVVEQVLRVIVAIGLAYFLLQWGYSKVWVVAGASFGGVAGSLGAIAVMLFSWWKLRRYDQQEGHLIKQKNTFSSSLSYGKIYRLIFQISIPIVIFSITVPLVNFIDSSSVIALIQGQVGMEKAKIILGILSGQALALAGIPIILAIALSQSIVPIISSAFAKKNDELVSNQTSKAIMISVITGIPMVISISAAARPLNAFLFGSTEGTSIIILLVVASMFQITMQTSGAILMGLGQMKVLIWYVIIGILIKVIGNYGLSLMFGIYGIIITTMISFIVMTGLNLRELRKHVSFQILGPRWKGLFLTVGITALIGGGAEILVHQFILPAKLLVQEQVHVSVIGRLYFGLDAMFVGCIAILFYVMLLVLTGVVRKQDIQSFPRPLQKVLLKGIEIVQRNKKQKKYQR